MNGVVANGGVVATITLPVTGNYLLFFNIRLTTTSTINYVNQGGYNWGLSLIDGTSQGNITGTFHYGNVGSTTINLNYNYNGTPGVAAGSYYTAIRIG